MRTNLLQRIFIRNFKMYSVNKNTLKETIPNATAPINIKKSIDSKNFSKVEEMYMSKINARNVERYQQEKKLKLHYRITGALLISFALSVYAYTMFAIRQEKFLDDFDVPEPPVSSTTANQKK